MSWRSRKRALCDPLSCHRPAAAAPVPAGGALQRGSKHEQRAAAWLHNTSAVRRTAVLWAAGMVGTSVRWRRQALALLQPGGHCPCLRALAWPPRAPSAPCLRSPLKGQRLPGLNTTAVYVSSYLNRLLNGERCAAGVRAEHADFVHCRRRQHSSRCGTRLLAHADLKPS